MPRRTGKWLSGWPRWLYSAALYGLAPLIWRRVWRESLGSRSRCERLGLIDASPSERPVIWLHAASVGEVLAARPLIEALHDRYPNHRLVVTTMTATGAERVEAIANALIASSVTGRLEMGSVGEVSNYFVPLDFPGAAWRFVTRLRPTLAIFFETEIWPNLLYACHQRNVPVAVVNGRLSSKAMRGYRRIGALMATALGNVDWLAAKSTQDAERFRQLGMPHERIATVGSLKFDIGINDAISIDSERLRTSLGERPVWIAGSTHPGEEEQLLVAHARLRQRHPTALLILVPRHPQRFDDVAALCQNDGERLARRSKGERVEAGTTIYLGDSMGELSMLYGAADMAFVGGSLVPIGGHNLLEPAAQGVPVLSGFALDNFSDVAEVLREANALIEVAGAAPLGEALIKLLDDPTERQRRAAAGRAAIEANRGALARTLDGLERLLPLA
ncbi:MAG TPA: lipid IV(A) 3-deoxy-D-manno-octulosonic acid transferase [Modicisalibacter sp.]|nr:lipid IV(A) 3-deoxy-D-manno-octulosonic acid transferase [Modicisalibacter sp.]